MRWSTPGPAIPGIAGAVAQLFAMADADDELNDLADDADQDNERPDRGDQQPGPPLRYIIVLHAPCHAEKAKGVHRHESDVEPDQPKPEGRLSPSLLQSKAEGLGEPVGIAGEGA